MPIQWRDQMSVGDAAIDEDHKKLLQLVNLYEDAIAKRNAFELKVAFQGLVEYAAGHFQREETLQERIGYPHCQSHHEEHQDLVERLNAFNGALAVPGRHLEIAQASSFLHDWIVEHLVQKDLKMKPFIEEAKKHKK